MSDSSLQGYIRDMRNKQRFQINVNQQKTTSKMLNPDTQLIVSLLEKQGEEFKAFKESNEREAAEAKKEFAAFKEVVVTKLERIESNTIIIRDAVISQFEGVTPSTKAAIQHAAEEVFDDPEAMAEIEERKGPAIEVRKPSGKFAKKTYAYVRFKDVVMEVQPGDLKGHVTAVGNWMSLITMEVFGVNFKGKYPKAMLGFLAAILVYYVTERTINRQY